MQINGVELHVETGGSGEPVVLVHGSWTDASSWAFVVPALVEAGFAVVAYDRRGHSRSACAFESLPRRQDEDDLVALIEALDLGPVHLVANSYGASIALGATARRPDLVRTLAVHEPPLLDLLDDGDVAVVDDVRRRVLGLIGGGDAVAGTRTFVEEVGLGPGGWDLIPQEARDAFVANAPTFVASIDQPGFGSVDAPAVRVPTLVTAGGATYASWLPRIAAELALSIDGAAYQVLDGCGHVPHLTHVEAYVAAISAFVSEASARAALG